MQSLIRELAGKAKPLVLSAASLVFPPRCLSCDNFIETAGTLCSSCWNALSFISEPCCSCCGYPFASAELEGTLCGHCIREAPEFTTARSALRYDEHSRRLVLGLKYADRTHGVPVYARWITQAGSRALSQAELVVPVPLHPLRLIARRFNQSALLAQSLANLSGIRYRPDILSRPRRTPPQEGLTRRQRLQNVANAFAVSDKKRSLVAGRVVLLVDDVITTGATINQCARALRKAGAKAVHGLSLARTVTND